MRRSSRRRPAEGSAQCDARQRSERPPRQRGRRRRLSGTAQRATADSEGSVSTSGFHVYLDANAARHHLAGGRGRGVTLKPCDKAGPRKEPHMPESVYKIIELVGTSTDSWEKAATAAVARAGKTLRDLRIAEVVQ